MSESPSYRNASPLYSKACEYDCLALLSDVAQEFLEEEADKTDQTAGENPATKGNR